MVGRKSIKYNNKYYSIIIIIKYNASPIYYKNYMRFNLVNKNVHVI